MSYFSGAWQAWGKRTGFVDAFCGKLGAFTLYDLGSAGGTPPPFVHLLPGIQVVNFEPDPRGESEPNTRTLPIAVGPEALTTVYLNQRPTTSSLLPPNRSITDRYDWERVFHGEGDVFRTLKTVEVETVGLDHARSAHELAAAHFIKIDVQGLTLEVLQSAMETLAGTLGVLAEMEFVPTYEGQSCFEASHTLLCEQGFELFRLSNICRWPYRSALEVEHPTGQDTFCDMLYMRSIDSIGKDDFWKADAARKQVLLFLLFNMPDVAAAYYERFVVAGLLERDGELEDWIRRWTRAETMFYEVPAGSFVQDSAEARERQWVELLVRERWAAQDHPLVYLFGAGRHTLWILSVLQERAEGRIAGIIDENSDEQQINGIPVLRPHDINDILPIVLSSDTSQLLFGERCRALFGDDVELVNLYADCPAGPYAKNF